MSIEKAVLAIESTEIPIWWEHDPTETPEETPEETKPECHCYGASYYDECDGSCGGI